MLCEDDVLSDIVPKLKRQFPGSEICVEPNEKVSIFDSKVYTAMFERDH